MASFWLMKSEPSVYSLADLEREGSTWWEGVRNHQARNFMQQSMRLGELFLFYHSNAEPAGVAGLGRVVSEAQPDRTALDPRSEYFDPKATLAKPIWFCVEVAFERAFKRLVTLAEIKARRELASLPLVQRGSRLSIHPVNKKDFELICQMGGL